MAGPDTLPTMRLSKQEVPVSNPEAAKPAAAKGMAGMVVGDTSVGYVDGAEGILEYRGD